MKIRNLVETCSACPSQWEFETDGGHMVYVRYRWGYLSVCASREPTEDAMDAVGGVELYGEQLGDGMDGVIGWEDVVVHLEDIDDVVAIVEMAKRGEEGDIEDPGTTE